MAEVVRPLLVVVLGMHRCGTSSLTRGLQVLGVELGDRLMPPMGNINEKGFWEDIDLNQLNVEMLAELDTDWHYLSPLKPDFVEKLRKKGFLLRAVDLVRKKVGGARCFGFKDPRVTQLLPFWLEVFENCECDLGYVLAIRNPISVAKSLQHRDGFDLEKSVLLWLGYTTAMLEGTAGIASRVLVDYDRLLRAPDRELARVGSALGLPVNSDELVTYQSEFLDHSLQHSIHRPDDLSLDEFTASMARDLYQVLLSAASDEIKLDAPALEKEITKARQELDRWGNPLRLIDSLYAFKRSTAIDIAEREVQIQTLKVQIENDRTQEQAARLQQQQLESQAMEAHARDAQLIVQLRSSLAALNAAHELERQAFQIQRDAQSQQLASQTAESVRREREAREQLDGHTAEFLRREQEFQARMDALTADFQRREQELQARIDAQTADAQRREMALLHRLEASNAESRKHAEELQLRLTTHTAESQRREKELWMQLASVRTRSEETEQSFLIALRHREEYFTTQLDSMLTNQERTREAERRLAQQHEDLRLKEFQEKEENLNRIISILRAVLAEFQQSWLWRLRSFFLFSNFNARSRVSRIPEIDRAGDSIDFDMERQVAVGGFDRRTPETISELLAYDDTEFVECAYRAILGRPPDPGGLAHYAEMLREGADKLEVARILHTSAEGRIYQSKLIGLKAALWRVTWRRLPLLAYFWRQQEQRRTLLLETKRAHAKITELKYECARIKYELRQFIEFDAESYQSINDDVAAAAINPYEHYLRFGYHEKRQTRLPTPPKSLILECDWPPANRPHTPSSVNPPIDIVIPVFNGYDFLGPLFETLVENTRAPYRLIVIDDCSTDSRVYGFLHDFAERHPGTVLVSNPTNQGFIASVNRGMTHVSSELFVLLNSDTEVPHGWLERLISPLQECESVATVTPFSNAATICSFPNSPADNPLYLGLSVNKIDAEFARVGNIVEPIEVPTGVGFCMAMRKRAVDEIGTFDPIYGRGYGEENDWCMRASALGYRHVLAVNLFVYHKHGGSFPSEDRARLIRNNLSILATRYPQYSDLVQAHIHADPAKAIRQLVKLRLLSEASGGATVIIDHRLGGGANAFRDRLIKSVAASGRPTIVIVHDGPLNEKVLMIAHDPDGETQFSFPNIEALANFLETMSVCDFVYNNLVGSTNTLKMVRVLGAHIEARMLPLKIMVHDFYPLCPSYTLINKSGSYCGIPEDLRICAACIDGYTKELLAFAPTNVDIYEWRSEWRKLILLATEVRCFSTSSRDIFLRAYPDLANRCTVVPHDVDFKPNKLPRFRPGSRLHIGVVGGINYSKGRGVLQSLARYIEDQGLEHKVSVIGQVDVPIRGVHVTGRYEVTRLPEMIEELGINVIFIPSVWPETFSYVTSEMIAMGMPVACFNIGAPAERVRSYERGIVLEGSEPETILKGLLRLCAAQRSRDFAVTE